MAESEAQEILKVLDIIRPIMYDRIVDKYDTYGSIKNYDVDKFLVNLAKNYAQFVQAAVYKDPEGLKRKAADVCNCVLMVLKSSDTI